MSAVKGERGAGGGAGETGGGGAGGGRGYHYVALTIQGDVRWLGHVAMAVVEPDH